MSDTPSKKQNMTAYERWEIPSFSDDKKVGKHGSAYAHNNETIVLPTAAQIQEIQRQAHDEGYQAGFSEGAGRIAELAAAMEQALEKKDQEIVQDLLDLSLEIARQMVQQVIKAKPEILLTVVREAISSMPHINHGAHLVVHPDDAIILRSSIGEQLGHSGWKIFEDPLIQRGGARVETANSHIDATVEQRWKRVVASIGQDNSWIKE